MISGTDIIKTLDLFPNEELTEIQQYIVELKTKRRAEKSEELTKRINEILKEAEKEGFTTIETNIDGDFDLSEFGLTQFY